MPSVVVGVAIRSALVECSLLVLQRPMAVELAVSAKRKKLRQRNLLVLALHEIIKPGYYQCRSSDMMYTH